MKTLSVTGDLLVFFSILLTIGITIIQDKWF